MVPFFRRWERLNPMRLLIAKDDFTSRMIMAKILPKLGHEEVAVADGAET